MQGFDKENCMIVPKSGIVLQQSRSLKGSDEFTTIIHFTESCEER